MKESAQNEAATEKFRVSSGRVLSVLAMRHGPLWGTVCAVPVVAALILGFALDARFFILALMVLMIFMPSVAAFLYFDHGLRPATALNTVEHSLRLDPDALAVTVFPPRRRRAAADVFDPEEMRREADEPDAEPREVRFAYADLSPYIVGLASIIIPAGRNGVLLVPASAFKAPTSLDAFAGELAARCGWKLQPLQGHGVPYPPPHGYDIPSSTNHN